MTKLLFFDNIYARKKGDVIMKLKDLEYNVYRAVSNYYMFLYNRRFKLVTNTDDKFNIEFRVKNFLNVTELNEYFKHSNGGKLNDMSAILDKVTRGDLKKLEEHERLRLDTACSIISNISRINLNTIHSIIEYKNNVYVILSIGDYIFGLKLHKYAENEYYVEDVLTSEKIDDIINKRDAYVSIPVKYDCKIIGNIPFGIMDRFKNLRNIYLWSNETKGFEKAELTEEDTSKRLSSIVDFIYLDDKGDPRENLSLTSTEMIKRSPIK